MIDDMTREQLNRYLDGSLSAAETSAFEGRLAGDANVRDALARQRQIDAALRRTFPAPAMTASALLSQIEGLRPPTAGRQTVERASNAPQPVGRINPLLRRLAIAAILLIGLFGGWQAWSYFQPKTPKYLVTAAQYFQNKEKQGYRPNWVCENDQQTIDIFNKHLGQAMVLKSTSADVRALGWDYAPILSPTTLVLLAEVGSERVMLFIDRKSLDNPSLMNQGCSGLHVHRKEIGDLVVYEFSRLEQPRVMDLLVQPTS